MRVLVTGDREWREAQIIYNTLGEEIDFHLPLRDAITIVHGDARGADTYAEVCAQLLGLQTEPHPAEWGLLGKRAGIVRNQEMLDSGIDKVLAFHHDLDSSRGTADMVRRAEKAGIEVVLIG